MIIDFMAAPNTKEYMSVLRNLDIQHVAAKLGFPSPREGPLEEFIERLEEAGVSRVVCAGIDLESVRKGKVANEYVARIAGKYRNVICGFGGIDPLKGKDAVQEGLRAVRELGLKGLSVDLFALGIYANDRRMLPIFEMCADLKVPLILKLGSLPARETYIRYATALPVDEMAMEFPQVKIICGHLGWPFLPEVMAVAFRHENVYIETSVYPFMPGAQIIFEATNTILKERVLFGTGFPFAPLRESVDRLKALPLTQEAYQRVVYGNAEEMLEGRGPARGVRRQFEERDMRPEPKKVFEGGQFSPEQERRVGGPPLRPTGQREEVKGWGLDYLNE